jgi:hypothetical protein
MESDFLRPWLMTMVELAHDGWTLILPTRLERPLLDPQVARVSRLLTGLPRPAPKPLAWPWPRSTRSARPGSSASAWRGRRPPRPSASAWPTQLADLVLDHRAAAGGRALALGRSRCLSAGAGYDAHRRRGGSRRVTGCVGRRLRPANAPRTGSLHSECGIDESTSRASACLSALGLGGTSQAWREDRHTESAGVLRAASSSAAL